MQNNAEMIKTLASISSDSYPNTVRKKKKYKELIRMIEDGRFGYFSEVAKELDINRETVARWYKTKSVQKALNQEAEEFVNRIPKPRFTWRESARILDMMK